MTREVPQLRDGRAFVAELSAADLAARYGTPLYVLDAAAIHAGLSALRGAVKHPRTEIYYSAKANPTVAVLSLLRGWGARLDACSPGDLAFAAAAGFAPAEISYTGHAMSDAEIRQVAHAGVQFTADSLSQLERFGALVGGTQQAVGLRVNVGIQAGFHPAVQAGSASSKFGVYPCQIEEAIAVCARAGLRLTGLHGHLGSHIADHRAHVELLDRLLGHGDAIEELEWINLGGGWSEPTYDLAAFGAAADERMRLAEQRVARPLALRLEPGAQIVINAGCLLTRVTELKPAVDLGSSHSPAFVGTDTSTNHLPSALLYRTRHPAWVADRAGAQPDGLYQIGGNLMQAADTVVADCPLPRPRPGDLLVIGRCGGYAAWRATTFNERPRPAEVLVRDANSTLVRRRETEGDLLRFEVGRVCADEREDPPMTDSPTAVRKSTTAFATEFGVFDLFAYEMPDGGEHLMLVCGEPARAHRPLVRVQSSCLTGTAFHALLCDCRQQLHTSLAQIAAEGVGCLLYLDQEGRGHGLVEKVEHLAAIAAGSDTVDAALDRGVEPDVREYSAVAVMLGDVLDGLAPIRLLTNNPAKLAGIEAVGVPIAARIPIEPAPTAQNVEYLRVKKRRMGHLLSRV